MNSADFIALLPYIVLAAASVAVMLAIAVRRSHRLTTMLTLGGFVLSGISMAAAWRRLPRTVTPLLIVDGYAYFYLALILFAGFVVAALSYSYLKMHEAHKEEFSLVLILAVLGCAVLPAAAHFASFFLGIELLSVSLYALAAYLRHRDRSVEAGVKYLILAAVSSAFILFGMALVYGETGSLAFSEIAARAGAADVRRLPFSAGMIMILAGLGFKLAVVPFHLWTPDVYEGAPAPVTAFIASASKGAVFAALLRFFSSGDFFARRELILAVSVIAIASMFAGNLLALLQTNIKRMLAYSSISHLGYLLVAVLAGGPLAAAAAAFYLTAYFITILGAFGVVTALSDGGRDADQLEDYRGLVWRRPLPAAVFIAALFSLAGIPLTAGFIAKFYIAAAGVESALWIAVIALAVNSVIGLFYYLRVIAALFARPEGARTGTAASRGAGVVLAALLTLLIALGVYPGPLIELIHLSVRALSRL